MKRSSGILMHISSLPGDYGTGDSPYQCFSAFAGNPYFIDLYEFVEKSYLNRELIKSFDLGENPFSVDYGLLYENKMALIKIAYNNSKEILMEDLEKFYKENIHWLREFSLFMGLKSKHNGVSWLNWEKPYRKFNSNEVMEFEKENKEEICFWIFTQFFFYKQWKKLKKYANDNKIEIIGDLPIYVSEDSSDTWSKPELFNLDEDLVPINVSGYPPDDFSDGGQLWGNPIYNWDKMEDLDYKWWVERIQHSFILYDYLRIDHWLI